MFSDKLKFLFIFLFLFSCDTVNDLDNLEETDSFSILSFSSHYDNSQNLLSVFSEISDNTNIEKIELIITSNGNLENGEVIFIAELFQSPYNQNIYFYEGQLSLSEEIYIYDIALIFSFNDNSDNLAYFDKISTPITKENSNPGQRVKEFIEQSRSVLDEQKKEARKNHD